MKKELFELKRNMRIELCNITKITGYIVDNNRDCRLEFTKAFLNIPETEQFKYLDIFGKVLSGKPGKNMFQLDFLDKERARYLNAIANTELKDDEVRQIFLEEIAESIDVSNKTYTLILIASGTGRGRKMKRKMTKPGNMRAFIYSVSKKMRKVRLKGTKK